MRHLTNIFRRLYRIFAHAWFQHRDVFWEVESNDGLYIFFKTVCDMYNLIPEDNYTVPPEAEGQDAQQPAEQETKDGRRLTILRKDEDGSNRLLFDDMDAPGATTRRHKHTPSTGSRVTTIAESAEDAEEVQKPLFPEVKKEPEQKKTAEQPAAETVGEQATPGDQVPDTSIETKQTTEEEAPKALETQPSESQPTEQQPDPEKSETQHTEPQPSEADLPEPSTPEQKPSESEKPATEKPQQPEQPTEEKDEPTEPEEPKEEATAGQQEKAAEEDASTKPTGPEPEADSKPEGEAEEKPEAS